MLTSNQLSRRVLIADDDPVIRRLVTSALEHEGFDVVAANDGSEAFRILQNDADFRAAILDMKMPNLEGLDLIRHMRTEKRLMRIPTVVITGETDLNVMSESFAAGAVLFLNKPFTREQLHITLGMVLSKN